MELRELKDFAAKQSKILSENNLAGYDLEKLILHTAVKSNEEIGELCDVVLSSIGSQRKVKNSSFKREQIGEEVADVFFTVSILAHLLEVDLEVAIRDKMKKVTERYNEKGGRTIEL